MEVSLGYLILSLVVEPLIEMRLPLRAQGLGVQDVFDDAFCARFTPLILIWLGLPPPMPWIAAGPILIFLPLPISVTSAVLNIGIPPANKFGTRLFVTLMVFAWEPVNLTKNPLMVTFAPLETLRSGEKVNCLTSGWSINNNEVVCIPLDECR